MPEVSVVMLSYNHERYIAEAIESVLRQTFEDLELIIVDDASTDNSQQIIQTYAQNDPRVKYVFHTQNEGIAKTSNDGLVRVSGRYVALASSDDVWVENKIEKQMVAIKKFPHHIIWGNGQLIDQNGQDLGIDFCCFVDPHHRRRHKSGNIFSDLIKGNYISSQTLLFEKEVLSFFRFNEHFKYLNDYIFCLDLASQYPFYFMDDCLFKYRRHPSNTTQTNKKVWQRDRILSQIYILKKYSPRMKLKEKSRTNFFLGKFLIENKPNWARKFILKSICLNPLKTSYLRLYLKSL